MARRPTSERLLDRAASGRSRSFALPVSCSGSRGAAVPAGSGLSLCDRLGSTPTRPNRTNHGKGLRVLIGRGLGGTLLSAAAAPNRPTLGAIFDLRVCFRHYNVGDQQPGIVAARARGAASGLCAAAAHYAVHKGSGNCGRAGAGTYCVQPAAGYTDRRASWSLRTLVGQTIRASPWNCRSAAGSYV